jgi:hypothetical protein
MARAVGVGVPVGGLTAGVIALALLVSAISLRWLDALVVTLFTVGLALAVASYVRGADERTRRVAIVAIGWNAFGLATLLALYTAG